MKEMSLIIAIKMELNHFFGGREEEEALFCEMDGGNGPCLRLLSPPGISYTVSVYIGDLEVLVLCCIESYGDDCLSFTF